MTFAQIGDTMEPVLNSHQTSSLVMTEGHSEPVWHGGWKARVLALAALIAVGAALIIWVPSVHRHKASTHGIADPSSAALRIANRTTDFAIRSVSIGDAEGDVADQVVHNEIGPGAEAVVEIAPGSYLVSVSYVETNQVLPYRPEGALGESFTVSPGKAVILHLKGGRSSPESLIFIAPKLAFK
jgi:hypothetical protein